MAGVGTEQSQHGESKPPRQENERKIEEPIFLVVGTFRSLKSGNEPLFLRILRIVRGHLCAK